MRVSRIGARRVASGTWWRRWFNLLESLGNRPIGLSARHFSRSSGRPKNEEGWVVHGPWLLHSTSRRLPPRYLPPRFARGSSQRK